MGARLHWAQKLMKQALRGAPTPALPQRGRE